MKTIGFAGTAKNTGKTTTIQAVIKQAHQAGLRVALTSIGFDVENGENATGSVAARFLLEKDDLVATAMDCLKTGLNCLTHPTSHDSRRGGHCQSDHSRYGEPGWRQP
jgi:nicotinamidase-related amidase